MITLEGKCKMTELIMSELKWKYCLFCQKWYFYPDYDAKYCKKCGDPLTTRWKCKKCGRELYYHGKNLVECCRTPSPNVLNDKPIDLEDWI